ncbi:hypothetical protein TNCV_958081 [Trichonephila clavipes]|nr:hypothetical protein TNCV_958081 [Trichonephila clavipes]
MSYVFFGPFEHSIDIFLQFRVEIKQFFKMVLESLKFNFLFFWIHTKGEAHQDLHRRIEAFSCAGSTVTHTQSPNARISVPIVYLLHVNGAHTNRRDQNAYDPGMDPQRRLWNLAISTLVQRSSGDKLLGRDLYQEIQLKAKNFRSRSGLSRGEFFTK